jgi:hypothetical protein
LGIHAHLAHETNKRVANSTRPVLQVADAQHNQRVQDTASELARLRRQVVDIQLGAHVLEDMPVDMRSRLYWVLCYRPDIAQELRVGCMDINRAGTVAKLRGLPAIGSPCSAPLLLGYIRFPGATSQRTLPELH